jgi:hypothetical protein
MSIRTTTAFAAGAIAALVIGSGTAYAATGGKFILGRSNAATSTTTLSNNYGTALNLTSKAGTPSLRVNRNTKVPLLNSDLLDGLDSGSFARATSAGTVRDTGYVDDGGTADPADDAVIALAICPAGSQVMGGGGADFTDDGVLFYSAPDGSDAWLVVSSTATLTGSNALNVEAYARCWNPRANVAGNARLAPAPHELSAAGRRAVDMVAAKR